MLSHRYAQAPISRRRQEQVATRLKSVLTIPGRALASGPARRPATVNRYSSCSSSSDRQSRWTPRAAGSTQQIATSPGPSAAPAASCSFPRGPLVNESTPQRHDWWQWLTSVVASAGRVAALALVVASLVSARGELALVSSILTPMLHPGEAQHTLQPPFFYRTSMRCTSHAVMPLPHMRRSWRPLAPP